MKYIVYKKGIWDYMAVTILYNLVFIIGIILTVLDNQKEAKYAMCLFIVCFIGLNITLYTRYRLLLSTVVFEEETVKCTFLKRVRRVIEYKEIQDYGVFTVYKNKFIYL